MRDPYEVLGIARGAPLEEVRRARRRLARELHPDVHPGAGERMAEANMAFEAIVRELVAQAGKDAQDPATAEEPAGRAPVPADADEAELLVAALPAEAFELLYLAMAELGDVLVADEPYLLEGVVFEPGPCLCAIGLIPEAGGSIATLTVRPLPRRAGQLEPPTAVAVAAALAAAAEALTRPISRRAGPR